MNTVNLLYHYVAAFISQFLQSHHHQRKNEYPPQSPYTLYYYVTTDSFLSMKGWAGLVIFVLLNYPALMVSHFYVLITMAKNRELLSHFRIII